MIAPFGEAAEDHPNCTARKPQYLTLPLDSACGIKKHAEVETHRGDIIGTDNEAAAAQC